MPQANYEIFGRDANGDEWIVATDDLPSAESVAEAFRAEGLTEIRVSKIGGVEPPLAP